MNNILTFVCKFPSHKKKKKLLKLCIKWLKERKNVNNIYSYIKSSQSCKKVLETLTIFVV
ncbi:hypothetical protein NCCP28_08830 [Niallia sp. NCCP-28]|nr:hypothetical protein NCCP28_08830 [Niallia sp. NCCP-28]